jgi:hypothetical protein
MAGLGMAVMGIGYILILIGFIMVLIPAFKESIGWGIAGLLTGIVAFIYGFMRWETCKKAMTIWLIGIGVTVVGGILMGVGMAQTMGMPMPPTR